MHGSILKNMHENLSYKAKGGYMPYATNTDLPDSVKNHLPEHAQSIYRTAFNNALEEYNSEERAFKVAWSAVKKEYRKEEDGQWVKIKK